MTRRKPVLVEFTGTPEAGKTTTISSVYKQLIAMGYNVRIYPESAEITPSYIPKGSNDFKLWIDADTFKHIIEAKYLTNYDIVIKVSINRRGGEGRIVTHEFVKSYNTLLNNFLDSVKVNNVLINTEQKTIEEVTAIVLKSILELVEEPSS